MPLHSCARTRANAPSAVQAGGLIDFLTLSLCTAYQGLATRTIFLHREGSNRAHTALVAGTDLLPE